MSDIASVATVLRRLSERDMLETVERHARLHGVTAEDVCGRGRTAAVSRARQAVWLHLRETTALSYPELGALFGRDHTSVLYGVRKCSARLVVKVRVA